MVHAQNNIEKTKENRKVFLCSFLLFVALTFIAIHFELFVSAAHFMCSMNSNHINQMDAQHSFTDEKMFQHRNQWNRQSTSTIKMPMLSASARNSPVSNQRHRFNLSTASLTSAISQTNNNYPSILDALDTDSLEDMLCKVCFDCCFCVFVCVTAFCG